MKPYYCTQNEGDCDTCGLSGFGLDCRGRRFAYRLRQVANVLTGGDMLVMIGHLKEHGEMPGVDDLTEQDENAKIGRVALWNLAAVRPDLFGDMVQMLETVNEFMDLRAHLYSPEVGGHAPDYLREAFCNAIEEDCPQWFDGLAVDALEVFIDPWVQAGWIRSTHKERGDYLLGQLWNCPDCMPGWVCDALELPAGSTYAEGVSKLEDEEEGNDWDSENFFKVWVSEVGTLTPDDAFTLARLAGVYSPKLVARAIRLMVSDLGDPVGYITKTLQGWKQQDLNSETTKQGERLAEEISQESGAVGKLLQLHFSRISEFFTLA